MRTYDTVANPRARQFLHTFFTDRQINREFYELVPDDQFDFRMVDRPERRSDSPRESLAHQIRVQHEYMAAIESGELRLGMLYEMELLLRLRPKNVLLQELDSADQTLVRLLSDDENANRMIAVPWDAEKQDVITVLQGLDAHEILHTGWNLAVMDHLNIKRFASLRAVWG